MLTEANFKDYVGFQPCTGNPAMVFMLTIGGGPRNDLTDTDFRNLSNDELIARMVSEDDPSTQLNLTINQRVVNCTLTVQQMLKRVNTLLLSFPKTDKGILYAQNRIALKSRRGFGNRTIDNIVLYKGKQEVDSCIVVGEFQGLYAIVTQDNFLNYGFVLV